MCTPRRSALVAAHAAVLPLWALLVAAGTAQPTVHASIWAAMQAEPVLSAFTRVVEACEPLRSLLQDSTAEVGSSHELRMPHVDTHMGLVAGKILCLTISSSAGNAHAGCSVCSHQRRSGLAGGLTPTASHRHCKQCRASCGSCGVSWYRMWGFATHMCPKSQMTSSSWQHPFDVQWATHCLYQYLASATPDLCSQSQQRQSVRTCVNPGNNSK
jgi:hypothetical protein